MKAALLLSLLLIPSGLPAGEFEVTLIQTQLGKPLGDDVPFDVKPMGHEPGVSFSFLVRGENLVSFKDDSVEIKTFKLADGREWSRTRSGKANWEQEHFSKVGESGKVGSFGIKFPGDLFGVIEGASLEGSIVAVTASKSEEKEITLTAGDKTLHELGPFEIAAGGGGGMFGGGKDATTINITGGHDGIIEVVVMDGDTKLDGNGSSWSGDKKSFHFEKAKGKELKVTVRYWSDLNEQAVPFAIAPAKK